MVKDIRGGYRLVNQLQEIKNLAGSVNVPKNIKIETAKETNFKDKIMNKQFVDTNYILRLLLKDNLEQYNFVLKFFSDSVTSNAKLVSNIVVLFQVYWVLIKVIKLEKEKTNILIYNFLQLGIIEFRDNEIILKALEKDSENSLDLQNNFHLAWCENHKIS